MCIEENKLPCFVGFFIDGAPLSEMCTILEKKYLDENNKTAIDGVYYNDSTSKRLVIAVPNEYSLNLVTSTGFQVPMIGPTNDFIIENGKEFGYRIYRTASYINSGPMVINCHIK